VKFPMIESMVGEKLPVKLCCQTLKVSRSGYYASLGRPESARKLKNDLLVSEIKQIHKDSRATYGLPRIQAELKNKGIPCGKNRLTTLMKQAGISGLSKRHYKVKTTDSRHAKPIAERVFKTEETATHPTGPNKIWAGDISYIHTNEGFLYLATYVDLFTRKVVGFSMADNMRTELLMSAIDMALGRQNPDTSELINHSDRGSQYASEEYREKMLELGVTLSMSRKGNCWDNAYAETFFATLKKELVYRVKYKTRKEAQKAIFEYIEVWYNRRLIHSSIGYMTPVQYEESLAI
jgi:putative transposase